MENQKENQSNPKNTKAKTSKQNGRQKAKQRTKWTCLFAFLLLCRFVFFTFFPGKKHKTSKIIASTKTNQQKNREKKNNKKAKGHGTSHSFQVFLLCALRFFLLLCFLDCADLLFDFPFVFLFSSSEKSRVSLSDLSGEHKFRYQYFVYTEFHGLRLVAPFKDLMENILKY